MEECEEGAMCDAGIISAAQKVEHMKLPYLLSMFNQTKKQKALKKKNLKQIQEDNKLDFFVKACSKNIRTGFLNLYRG